MKELSARDDSMLWRTVEEMREWRRTRGIPDPKSDLEMTIAWWKARRPHVTEASYPVFILVDPCAGDGYRVYCPLLPSIVARGETLAEAKARLAEALSHYLASLTAEDKLVSHEGEFLDTIEVPLPQS